MSKKRRWWITRDRDSLNSSTCLEIWAGSKAPTQRGGMWWAKNSLCSSMARLHANNFASLIRTPEIRNLQPGGIVEITSMSFRIRK